jgi:hypothetical protein
MFKYRFKSRGHIMQEMARISSVFQAQAFKTVDPEIRAFYNGKVHMCAELIAILSASEIDGMETTEQSNQTGNSSPEN